MKKRLRIAVMIIAFVFVGVLSFELGSRLHQTTDSVEIIAETLPFCSENRRKIVVEKTVSDIAIVDRVAVIADGSGFGILDEWNGVEMQVTTAPSATVTFDGKKAYFVRKGIEDGTITVRSRGDEFRDENSYDENENPVVWEKGRICSYDVTTFQIEDLFETNGVNACVVFADEDYLYYTDCADENVDGHVDERQLVAPTLFRYDLKKKTSEVISAYASKVGTVGSTIVYTDSKAASFRHKTLFYGGGLHFYDTDSKTDYYIAEDSEFLYAEGNDFVYATITDSSSAQGDPVSHPVTYVTRCRIDGKNSSEVKHIDGAWKHHVGPYLEFKNDDGYKIYNTSTDQAFDSKNWFDQMSDDGQLISMNPNEPALVYTISEKGEEELLFDVSDLLPNGYTTTRIFNMNGFYCESKEENEGYCFIPWKAGHSISSVPVEADDSETIDQTKTTQKQSAEKREIMWKNQDVSSITSFDATIEADISFIQYNVCVECGFYIGTSINNLHKNERYDSFNMSIGPRGINFYFNLKEYGQILKSGTTYYYMIYIKDKSGNEFTSEVKSFTTR